MFSNPAMVFRRGNLVMRNGELLSDCQKTILISEFQARQEALKWGSDPSNQQRWEKQYGYSPWPTALSTQEFLDEGMSVEHAHWHE